MDKVKCYTCENLIDPDDLFCDACTNNAVEPSEDWDTSLQQLMIREDAEQEYRWYSENGYLGGGAL